MSPGALARAADLVTLGRLTAAPVLAALVAADALAAASVLLSAAWIADFVDGPLARASDRTTRLGNLDLAVDAAVGAGVLVGLGLARSAAAGAVTLAVAVALGGGYLALRNPALALALQAIAWAWLGWKLLDAREPAALVPAGTVLLLLLAGWRRLLVVVPAFLHGVAALARRRRGPGLRLPDR